MTTLVDYAGRRADLLAYQGGAVGSERQLLPALALPGEGGRIVAGIEKLAQRFLLELFTEKGSMSFWQSRGCEFVSSLLAGDLRTPADAIGAFSRSMVDIRRNLQEDELSTDPDDERFADARLLEVAFTPDRVAMRVWLQSKAGDSRVFLAPIPTTVQNGNHGR